MTARPDWPANLPGTLLPSSLPVLLETALQQARSLADIHREGGLQQPATPSRPAWLAPEQTGRTGRTVDQRTDLYRLGATLYELITGRPPFDESDPLQLVHQVLAQAPLPPLARVPDLPPLLSALVMKLLEKEPDRRYQSADGLAQDLEQLLQQQRSGDTAAFALGEHDFAARLAAPARPVGREAECAALQAAFEAALGGAGRGVLIGGAPGVGKTTLINELRPWVAARRGWFIGGKFDQYRRDLRSDAVWQAFQALGQRLLAEPEAELAQLRPRMLRALGANAGLVAAMHPEYSLLLGVPPEAAGSDPIQAERRLVQACLALLRSVASPARPLVMVIDDLQWAAALPLAFVDAVLTDASAHGVLVVCAYRDAEVDAAHPLAALCERWQRLGAAPLALTLTNLPPADLGQLLAGMLRLSLPRAAELAQALAERTAGNPFDTVELVNALRHDGVLVHDSHGWHWDADEIRHHVGQGNVIDLLAARIARLPAAAGDTLAAMACLGGEVEPALLAAACDLDVTELLARVAPALDDGLLVAASAGDAGAGDALRFRHDRVQQAAIERLDGTARQALQLQLARRLAAHADFGAVAAAQYLGVAGAIDSDDERRLAARLLHTAAAQLRHVNNALAERLLTSAAGLLAACADGGSGTPLGSAVAVDRHAALYALGRLAEADEVYRCLAESTADILQRAAAGAIQISSLTHRGRTQQALDEGLALLPQLGFPPLPDDLAACVQSRLEALSSWDNAGSGTADVQRPAIAEPHLVAAAWLLNRMGPAAFFADKMLMAWLTMESHRLWTEHGPCPPLISTAASVCVFAVVLRGDYRGGYLAASRAVQAGQALGCELETAQAQVTRACFATHWFEPLEQADADARQAAEMLVRGGDLQFAGFSFTARLMTALDCAAKLDTLSTETEAAYALSARSGDAYTALTFEAFGRLAQALRGATAAEGSFGDGDSDEATLIERCRHHAGALAHFHTLRALSAVLFGQTEALLQHSAAAMPLLAAIRPTYHTALAQFLYGLALAERLKTAAPEARAALLAEFDAGAGWLRERAVDAPFNFSHWVPWLDAERAWALAQPSAAASAFDAALQQAAHCRRPWHQALLAERAAQFHQSQGMLAHARLLFADATQRYAAWGASAKLRQLEQVHGALLAPAVALSEAPAAAPVSADAIDMLAIVRASQALSSETSLESLRQRVAGLLGEMTGATAVRIVLWNDALQQWQLPAVPRAEAAPDEAAPHGLLPLSVLRYAERTREPLLLDDAIRDDRFAADPYLAGATCCSLLAVPIQHHGALRALLLLENRLGRGAFGAGRLDAVMLITGQLAVSLVNAQLYEELEQRVRERTRELQQTQDQLLAAARQAGMAEIATNVLHNVGNVLNSVNVSAGLVGTRLRKSKVQGLARAAAMLDEHAAELGTFLTHDPKGRLLPGYLRELAQALVAENAAVADEVGVLSRSIDHIKEIVATQQSYAGASRLVEPIQLGDLVDDALRMNAGALTRHNVAVDKVLPPLPLLPLDRHRLLQILVNLISNAKHAMNGVEGRAHQIRLAAALIEDKGHRRLRITVADNGVGIAAENLTRVFSHGFTTRKNGHGFGLHSCALAAREMGGSLLAHSDGSGHGATFTLDIPVDTPEGPP